MAESDSYVDGTRKRIPDLTYFSERQLEMIRRNERVSALFAIEILSNSETHENVLDKIAERGPQDYFDGGAKLVWYIVPRRKEISAYSSPEEYAVLKGSQTITAAPVVPEFAFVVDEMFAVL